MVSRQVNKRVGPIPTNEGEDAIAEHESDCENEDTDIWS